MEKNISTCNYKPDKLQESQLYDLTVLHIQWILQILQIRKSFCKNLTCLDYKDFRSCARIQLALERNFHSAGPIILPRCFVSTFPFIKAFSQSHSAWKLMPGLSFLTVRCLTNVLIALLLQRVQGLKPFPPTEEFFPLGFVRTWSNQFLLSFSLSCPYRPFLSYATSKS